MLSPPRLILYQMPGVFSGGGGCSWLELTRPLAVKTETVVSEQLGFIKGVYLSVLGICSSYRQAVTVL